MQGTISEVPITLDAGRPYAGNFNVALRCAPAFLAIGALGEMGTALIAVYGKMPEDALN